MRCGGLALGAGLLAGWTLCCRVPVRSTAVRLLLYKGRDEDCFGALLCVGAVVGADPEMRDLKYATGHANLRYRVRDVRPPFSEYRTVQL